MRCLCSLHSAASQNSLTNHPGNNGENVNTIVYGAVPWEHIIVDQPENGRGRVDCALSRDEPKHESGALEVDELVRSFERVQIDCFAGLFAHAALHGVLQRHFIVNLFNMLR